MRNRLILAALIIFLSCEHDNPYESEDRLPDIENFNVEALSDHEIALTWDPVSHADRYVLKRVSANSELTIEQDSTGYLDSKLTTDVFYSYHLHAETGDVRTLTETIDDIKTKTLNEIDNFTVAGGTANSTVLSWTNASAFEVDHEIQFNNGIDGYVDLDPASISVSGGNTYSFTHGDITPFAPYDFYTYRIRAVTDYNSSSYYDYEWDNDDIIASIANSNNGVIELVEGAGSIDIVLEFAAGVDASLYDTNVEFMQAGIDIQKQDATNYTINQLGMTGAFDITFNAWEGNFIADRYTASVDIVPSLLDVTINRNLTQDTTVPVNLPNQFSDFPLVSFSLVDTADATTIVDTLEYVELAYDNINSILTIKTSKQGDETIGVADPNNLPYQTHYILKMDVTENEKTYSATSSFTVQHKDCNEVVDGVADRDDCDVCVGGNTGLDEENADKDCAGVCFGDSTLDACDVCDGSNIDDGTGFVTGPDADCAGDCDGDAVLSGCDNLCNSTAVEDCAGVCGGNDFSCADCAGTLNGDAVEDNCGTCDSDSANDCVQDCDGTWGGDAVVDECGECEGDETDPNNCP